MPVYAFDCECDGRDFHGTALQPGRRTVSQVLREALTDLHGTAVLTRTCGRLDAGVSAESLVVSSALPRDWPPLRLGRALNVRLPADLAVHRVARVADDWDALAAPSRKHYRYRVHLGGSRPVLDPWRWWLRGPCVVERLPPLAEACVGRLDLSAFSCLRGDASDQGDPLRDYDLAKWRPIASRRGRCWQFDIRGSGFLYKQVRGLVGAMIAVAQQRARPEDFFAAIGAGRDRQRLAQQRVGQIAPAIGLRLHRVHYDDEPDWQELDVRG